MDYMITCKETKKTLYITKDQKDFLRLLSEPDENGLYHINGSTYKLEPVRN